MINIKYFITPSWLFSEYELSCNEASVYGLILAYTRDDKDRNKEIWFRHTTADIAEYFKISENCVYTALKKLYELGLLQKRNSRVGRKTLCDYRAIYPQEFDHSPPKNCGVKDGSLPKICGPTISINTNTINSISTNTNSDNKEQDTATPRRGLLKNSSSRKPDKTKSWASSKVRLLAKFNFSQQVHNELLKFFQMLTESGTLLPDTSIQAQLEELSKLSDDKQLNAVRDTIARGWKSLVYRVREESQQKRPSFDTATKSTPQLKDPKNDRRHEEYEGQEVF